MWLSAEITGKSFDIWRGKPYIVYLNARIIFSCVTYINLGREDGQHSGCESFWFATMQDGSCNVWLPKLEFHFGPPSKYQKVILVAYSTLVSQAVCR